MSGIKGPTRSLLKGIPFDDLDEGFDDGTNCRSLTRGPKPILQHFDELDEEFVYILNEIKALEEDGVSLKDICIVAQTNRLLDDYIQRLLQHNIRPYEIKPNQADDRTFDGVRLATMHRVKGLEFHHVFIAAVNDRVVPHHRALDVDDDVSYDDALTAERCLLYVALTRAKQTAHITSYGNKSTFISEVEKSIAVITRMKSESSALLA